MRSPLEKTINWLKGPWFSFDRWLGLAGLVIGITLGVYTALPGDRLVILCVSLFGLVVALIGLCFALTVAKDAREVQREEEVARRDKETAREFKSFMEMRVKFDADLVAFTARCAKYPGVETEGSSLAQLRAEIDAEESIIRRTTSELYRSLCDTAVNVIGARKSVGSNCAANIKTLHLTKRRATGEEEIIYMPVVSSRSSSTARNRSDERLREQEPAMMASRVYSEIFNSRSHCLIDDLSRYEQETVSINNERHTRGEPRFTEPSKATLRNVESALVVPIYGPMARATEAHAAHSHPVGQSFHGGLVCGFFCIDSPEKGVFNCDYDLLVMEQLSMEVFSITRMALAASELWAVNRQRGRVDKAGPASNMDE